MTHSLQIEESRERLLSGVRRFRREVFPERETDYRRLAKDGQRPHALFLTCADSRIDPELITQSGPGEIFVSRNIGNLVPAYGDSPGGVSAILEYAVVALQVKHVVVCGHSDCGAMIGLLHPEKVSKLPVVKGWLRHGEAALSIVRHRDTAKSEPEAIEELIDENVVLQLQHLRTHPSVAGRLAKGVLALSGWVFDIGKGSVRVYDEERRGFVPVEPEHGSASGASSR